MNAQYIGFFLIIGTVPLNAMKRPPANNKQIVVAQKKLRQETPKNSLVEFFGQDRNMADAKLQHIFEVQIAPLIIPNGWWVPQTRLDLKRKKYQNVRFTPQGDKIITFRKGVDACVWNAQDGKLLSRCDFTLYNSAFNTHINRQFTTFPKYTEDTNELLFINPRGIVSCWNINQNVFRYTTEPLGRVYRSVWSRDKKKVIIVYDAGQEEPVIVIDTTTGLIEKKLVSHIDFYEQVGFIKDSHKAIVFLENVGNYQDDESVEYKKLPFQELLDEEGTEYRYFGKENKLIAILTNLFPNNILLNVFDVENNSIKRMEYPCKKDVIYSYFYIKNSKLILEHNNYSLENDSFYPSHNGIDIWDLESEQNTFTMTSHALLFSFNQLNNRKNVLLVRNFHGVSLWDVRSQALIAQVDNIKHLADTQLNKQGDKFIILTNDYAQVWEPSALTFKQIVLRKLLNFYWQTSRPFLSINSPKKLLDAVVQKFQHSGRIATRTREGLPAFCLDKNELQEVWNSFPEKIRAMIWQSIFCKIKRYGK